MMPLWIVLLIRTAYNIDIDIPWGIFFIYISLILGPTAFGLWVRKYNTETVIGGKLISKWLEHIASAAGAIFLALGLAAYLYEYWHQLRKAPPALWIIAVLMEPLGFGFGYIGSYFAGLSRKNCRTVALETGVQNFPIAIAVISQTFPAGEQRTRTLLFPLMYGILWIVNSFWMVVVLRYFVAGYDDEELTAALEDQQDFQRKSDVYLGLSDDDVKVDVGVEMAGHATGSEESEAMAVVSPADDAL